MARSWRTKFREAFRGIGLVFRHESSFRVHVVVAVWVVALAAVLKCDVAEWAVLLLCIGMVLAAEAFNASIETMFHALDDATKARMTGCLDRVAGAVLLVSLASAAVGLILFGRRVWMVWNP
jgi:diacylglycerol kinase